MIRVPEAVADLESFPELLAWAMTLWGEAGGVLDEVNDRAMHAPTAKTFYVSGTDAAVGTIDFGPHPHHAHAQWFLRLGTAVRKGYVDRLDQIDSQTRGYKNAGSANRWYTGEGIGRQSAFPDFCSAVGIPEDVERYLVGRFSKLAKLYEPTRFRRLTFNGDLVAAAVDGSASHLREHPWVERLKARGGSGSSGRREPVAHPAPALGGPVGGGAELSATEFESLGLPNRVGLEAATIGAEAVAGAVVLDAAIREYDGVDLSSVVVVAAGDLEDDHRLPASVRTERRVGEEPVPNKPKAFLVDWSAPIIDQGDVVSFRIARSDYRTSQAFARMAPAIQADVRTGDQDVFDLPRRLDVHVVVVCEADGTVVLAKRAAHLATEPSTWMVTVGESMDWDRDRGADGVPHPAITARRCLTERDELNLPAEVAASADLRLVALATEWCPLLANMVVVARLPDQRWTDVAAFFRRGENVRLDAIPFEPSACGQMLRAPLFAGTGGRGRANPVSDISRVALIAALRSSFTRDEVAGMARS